MVNPMDSDLRTAAWKAFLQAQEISPNISANITNSWQRCWLRLNPFQKVSSLQLNPDHLLAAQVASFELISVARPIMEDIFQYIEGNQTAVVLVNGAGYVLDILGDTTFLDQLKHQGIQTGVSISESQIGTNATALALIERVPVCVVGAEHFLHEFHNLVTAAAPIFDMTGRPLGAFGLINSVAQYQPHTLGLAVAGARAVESQRQADTLLAEQNSHLAELNVILSAISDGILVWNADKILIHINSVAAKVIGVPAHTLVGKRIGDILSHPSFLQDAINRLEPLTDVEAMIELGQHAISCVLSLRFVLNRKDLQWIIITFRQEKEVRQLIQQQVGAHASLTLDDIIGESQEIRRVRRLVKSAAAARASVMIRGESGTGKNVVASAIHTESYRRDGPFLIFACSSVPNELVVSELLGYDEGMNSKKPGGRPSKFELANGGTLFFQDVDALPLEAQAILLNVVELGIVQRLGSDRPIPLDVRILAASSANMEKLIAQGNFRADLFYRLSPFEITLPPLRERNKDLPTMVEKILRRLSRQLNHPLSLSPDVIDLLIKYPWPGNIRELEAVLGRAAVHAGASEVIGPMHLPKFISTPLETDLNGSPIQPLNQVERDALLQALQVCKGNVTRAADVLGIGRTTIWRKLKQYGIRLDDYRVHDEREKEYVSG